MIWRASFTGAALGGVDGHEPALNLQRVKDHHGKAGRADFAKPVAFGIRREPDLKAAGLESRASAPEYRGLASEHRDFNRRGPSGLPRNGLLRPTPSDG